ncbi:hypothetical protein BT63DRAFT_444729 [Microthyrium microscopicum]|uniref:Uncharacterized protein n=1 Tax=Microthyrium microscopicum TaxID=703497 RepID=A0A6A6TV12_9PEZI|nr:hypothetical protein BT63DRAFT_444729 [Microthyrium microscopicum]
MIFEYNKMGFRQAWLDRGRDASWTLTYAFNLLMGIGLLIASEITNKYGREIFGASATNNAAGSGNDSGFEENAAAINLVERDHALARSGVVSSNRYCCGSQGAVSIILTITSFAAYKYLDHKRHRKDTRKDYDQRSVVVLVFCVFNVILSGACVGLIVGFVITSRAVKLYTTVESSATPGYLIAAAVMARLNAATLFSTVFHDFKKLRWERRIVKRDDEERVVPEQEK